MLTERRGTKQVFHSCKSPTLTYGPHQLEFTMTSFKRIFASAVLVTTLCSPLAYASDVSQPRTMWEDFTAYIQQIGPQYANRAIAIGFSVCVGVFLFGKYVGHSRALAGVSNTRTPVLGNDGATYLTLGQLQGTLQERLRDLYDFAKKSGTDEILEELGDQVVLTGDGGFKIFWSELEGNDLGDKIASLLRLYTQFREELLQ